MEKFPPELLERVFMYLPPRDRMESALTCRRWAEIMSSSSLLEDVWLKARGCNWVSFEATMIGSERQYRNLQISGDKLLLYSPEFWMKIGRNLRTLEFLYCGSCPRVFYEILRECVNLESLRILKSSRGKLPLGYLEPPGETWVEEVRKSLCNVRHLHLDISLGADFMARLLSILPDVGTVSLSGFKEGQNSPKFMPSVLGAGRVITELDLGFFFNSEEYLIQLVRAGSGSLRKFRHCGRPFTLELYEAVCGCTKLRHLSLPRPEFIFDDDHLKQLLLKIVDLESLELHANEELTAESLIPIREQKKLRKLGLVYCNGFRTTDLLNGLGEISKLQSLDLRGSAIDVRTLQSLARLPNLRELSVSFDNLSNGSLKKIVENLDALSIINCDKLSAADGTKIRRFAKLKSLSIEKDFGFTDPVFENWIRSAALESIELRNCSLTDAGLASIAAHHNCLKTLTLENCPSVTNAGLVTLIRGEPRLEELKVVDGIVLYCISRVSWTEEVLGAMQEFCPRIRVLRISEECEVNEGAMERLRARRPALKVVRGFSHRF